LRTAARSLRRTVPVLVGTWAAQTASRKAKVKSQRSNAATTVDLTFNL
jgi:hypothetical protein